MSSYKKTNAFYINEWFKVIPNFQLYNCNIKHASVQGMCSSVWRVNLYLHYWWPFKVGEQVIGAALGLHQQLIVCGGHECFIVGHVHRGHMPCRLLKDACCCDDMFLGHESSGVVQICNSLTVFHFFPDWHKPWQLVQLVPLILHSTVATGPLHLLHDKIQRWSRE